jgi:ankyrin repeat protein
MLLDKKAQIDLKDNYNYTALLLAAAECYGEAVKLLIANGADINARDEWSSTPLSRVAGCRGQADLVKLLIDRGADPKARDDNGWTVLECAAAFGNTEGVRLLLAQGVDVNAQDKEGSTPLFKAALDGAGDIVRLLIEKGAKVNISNNKKQTVLAAVTARIKEYETKGGKTEEIKKLKEVLDILKVAGVK